MHVCCMHFIVVIFMLHPKGGSEPNLAHETELLVQKHLIELKLAYNNVN